MNVVLLDSIDDLPERLALRTIYKYDTSAYAVMRGLGTEYDVIYCGLIELTHSYVFMFNGTLKECRQYIYDKFNIWNRALKYREKYLK